ncbi:translation initiation factor IF-3 [Paenibacillus sp. HN-1]|uniref:translation initiation factor IF-3 n=1 Tax=Paenibacillus TaxID=44249 RepID=UPI001CA80AA0|nr:MULTISPECIES: translation initiation factor IF-3 [Paenibacillus]MBY9077909.1 translation initiation factor IF-3 [Paenibacillus sp. CGMCC 1.18879]MBY9088135.1 translation initiation factor IF-3 [Paenibacillus sinensis]
MAVLMNEQIKASEVSLTGLHGEQLGVISRDEALAMAVSAGADLVCTSLMSSPPPCTLMAKGTGKAAMRKESAARRAEDSRASGGGSREKAKELRFTAFIEDHDYETKLRQAEKLLLAGKPVLLTVKAAGAKEAAASRAVLERLVNDLKTVGVKDTGIQSGGKGSQVKLNPR